MHFRLCFPTFLMVVVTAAASHAGTITFDSLLDEMTDRSAIASFPHPAYTCRQDSSYDRKSMAADKPDWFANDDRSQFIRSEINEGREEWVMMDAQGPGAIVRWWVTAPAYKGTIRVYLDGSSQPVITAKVDDLIGGDALVGPPLSSPRARGRNLYLPIPYAKGCKVTFDRPNYHVTNKHEDLLYYQINYRSYAAGTRVESFTQAGLAAAKEKIAKLQNTLLKPGSVMPKSLSKLDESIANIKAGEQSVDKFEGPGAICRLSVRIEAEDMAQALRSTVLVMEFDGTQTVWCPLGDFFGSGVGVNPYTGWYREVCKYGLMTCWWVMPYEKSCTIRLKNLGKQTLKDVDVEIDTCPWKWDDRSMHFYTTWRQQRNISTEENGRGAFDWNYLSVDGQGVFAGDTLTLLNRDPGWWGEGDEKIYVDGESFPSHFGTARKIIMDMPGVRRNFSNRPSTPSRGPRGRATSATPLIPACDCWTAFLSKNRSVSTWKSGTGVKPRSTMPPPRIGTGRPGAKAEQQPDAAEAAQPVKYDTPNRCPRFGVSPSWQRRRATSCCKT